jgi:hypothetical protein
MGKYDFEDTMERWVKEHPREHGLALVVNELRREYLCTNEEGYNIEPCPCEDYEGCLAKPFIQAILLLEAAGKVDKKKAIEALDGIFVFAAIHGITTPDPDVIAAMDMIKALPD